MLLLKAEIRTNGRSRASAGNGEWYESARTEMYMLLGDSIRNNQHVRPKSQLTSRDETAFPKRSQLATSKSDQSETGNAQVRKTTRQISIKAQRRPSKEYHARRYAPNWLPCAIALAPPRVQSWTTLGQTTFAAVEVVRTLLFLHFLSIE
jgi:hypothetical protein